MSLFNNTILECNSALASGEQLTASSEYSANHAAKQGILNYKDKSGSWSAQKKDLNQWLQADLGQVAKVTSVATQGRYSSYQQWVTKYKLEYYDDGENFKFYKEQGQTIDKVIFERLLLFIVLCIVKIN